MKSQRIIEIRELIAEARGLAPTLAEACEELLQEVKIDIDCDDLSALTLDQQVLVRSYIRASVLGDEDTRVAADKTLTSQGVYVGCCDHEWGYIRG